MGGSERNVPAALSPPGWGLGLGSARAGPVSRGRGFAPPSLVASCAGRAGVRRGLGSALAFRASTLRVTDWPQSPAGLLCAGLRLDRAGQRWPQAPAGLSGSRFLRHGGGAGPRRGTSSQTAWCGVSWSMAASCAVCCGGTPTRPHPTVSYAADRRRGDKAVTDDSLLHSDHRCRFSWSQRSMGDGLSSSLPPAGRRRRDGRAGTGRGAPAANCTHGRHTPIDPAPCSL